MCQDAVVVGDWLMPMRLTDHLQQPFELRHRRVLPCSLARRSGSWDELKDAVDYGERPGTYIRTVEQGTNLPSVAVGG